MKTAIVSFYEAHPPASGAASVTYNLAKYLPGERLLIQIGRCGGEQISNGLRIVTLAGASESRITKLTSLSQRIQAMVREIVRFRPDCVILEGASWAVYHLMLLRAVRKATPGVRVIYHSHNVEYLLRLERNGRAIAAITRRAEGRLLAESDLATAVSEIDRTHFRALYDADTALLPNGVDVGRFTSVTSTEIEQVRRRYGIGEAAVIFSGLYAYQPNREAVDFLRRDVMPRLIEQIPGAQLVVTGGEIARGEQWLVSAGLVPYEDLPALITACKVAAVPVFSGSGTRLKILEAMASGVPVVATEKAVEGLELYPGEDFLLANDQRKFVVAIATLFKDSALATPLRRSAARKVKEKFSWRTIVDDFEPMMVAMNGSRIDENVTKAS